MRANCRSVGARRRSIALPLVLCLSLAAAMVGCSSPEPETRSYVVTPEELNTYILESSYRFNVPAAWIRAVMQVESGGQTYLNGRPITSHAGAMGLMQVMPATYDELRREYGLGQDPHHPRDNILAGTAYLRQMYDLFGSPGFLAAYNAGPGRYAQYVHEGRPLPAETVRYVSLIHPRIAGIYPRGDYAGSVQRNVSEDPGRGRLDPG